MFQAKANQFYLRFTNTTNNTSNTNNNKNISAEIDVEASAGYGLVKQTILVCNGPWFSYQMNNLLVLPFSLILTVVFSLIKKKTSKNPNQKYLRLIKVLIFFLFKIIFI